MGELYTILATQNPVEQEGTYKLPEAQLDRFLMKLTMDYPSLDEESLRIVKSMPKWTPGKMKDGKVVRVQYTVPLTYRLQ